MDYVEALAHWCVCHGVHLPTYRVVGTMTVCTFQGKEYHATPTNRLGEQCAAQEAYETSGVFGAVYQAGFVPRVRRDKEVLVDLAHAFHGVQNKVLSDAQPNVQLSFFAPFNDTTSFPPLPEHSDYGYTVYTTVHPTDDAFDARISWYIHLRAPAWRKHNTTVHVYSGGASAHAIKQMIEHEEVECILD